MLKFNLSKAEAISALQVGEKVTHKYFSPTEWMMSPRRNLMLFEDGHTCSFRQFFEYRVHGCWEDGYAIYREMNDD